MSVSLGIAIPCRDHISATAFKYFARFFLNTSVAVREKYGEEANVTLATQTRCHVHVARWYLLTDLLSEGCTHILWLDDDACPPPDLALRLLAHEKPIIAARFTDREGKPVAKHMRIRDGKYVMEQAFPEGVSRIGVTGFHALLMTADAARKVIAAAEGASPFQFPSVGPAGTFEAIGEDHWFFRHALHAGVELWIDPSISVGHVGEKVYE